MRIGIYMYSLLYTLRPYHYSDINIPGTRVDTYLYCSRCNENEYKHPLWYFLILQYTLHPFVSFKLSIDKRKKNNIEMKWKWTRQTKKFQFSVFFNWSGMEMMKNWRERNNWLTRNAMHFLTNLFIFFPPCKCTWDILLMIKI